MAIHWETTMSLYAAKRAVPAASGTPSSPRLEIGYATLAWKNAWGRIYVKVLNANRGRLSAKIASLSEQISSLQSDIYPSRPRRWQRLAYARGFRQRPAENAAVTGCSPLASKRSSLRRWVFRLCLCEVQCQLVFLVTLTILGIGTFSQSRATETMDTGTIAV